MKWRPLLRAVALAGLCFGTMTRWAVADDSSAVIAAGGIVFEKNDKIVMESEDLFLSRGLVRVRFVFLNQADHDLQEVVAFPLPNISIGSPSPDIELPFPRDPNFVGFTVAVNGKQVTPSAETKAFAPALDGRGSFIDVTDVLADILHRDWSGKKLDNPSSVQIAKARARGALLMDPLNPYPLWQVATKLYWTQRFSAHRATIVEHSYRPIVGSHFGSFEDDGYGTAQKYCVSPSTKREADRRIDAAAKAYPDGQEGTFMNTDELAYVLKTGANWNGPIRRFKLEIETDAPDMLFSTCFPDLKQTGPTHYVFAASDFTPTQDIAIAMGAIAPAPAPYLVENSDVAKIDPVRLAVRGHDFLRLARNEIYARHGRVFDDPWLRQWFSRQSWYRPRPGPVHLTKIEADNVAAIERLEGQLKSGGH